MNKKNYLKERYTSYANKLHKNNYVDHVNEPILFLKKINNKIYIKPRLIKNDTGKTRHFTPAAQEWYNSIYAYNGNYTTSLPTAGINLINILKSYFNFQFKDKGSHKGAYTRNRYRRSSANRIFVGRGDLKHTSTRVIITFFVYNVEKNILRLQIENTRRNILYPTVNLKRYVNMDKKGNIIITYNRVLSINELKKWHNLYEFYFSYIINIVNKLTIYLGTLIEYYGTLSKLVEKKILTEEDKLTIFINKVRIINSIEYPNFNIFLLEIIHAYKQTLRRLKYLVYLNRSKFKKNFIWKLTRLVQNIYNKEVEFNIVNIKKMHLNSDIFTQAVALKLRNKNNKLFRVLRSSLSKIKLPNEKKVSRDIKSDKNKYLINKIRNNKINSMFIFNTKRDSLNNLLSNYYPSVNNLTINIDKLSRNVRRSISIENYVLKFLKHIKLRGIRVEAKGRLTRRFTASRSVFKLRWKGGLKNIDSSFRGLSTIMLRGYVKSNLQYSMLNSKTRNGAFGVKGWIANK